MIVRYILLTVVLLALFLVVRAALRSLFGGSPAEEKKSRLPGDEMVLDPECRTYVVKRRAVSRRIGDNVCYFCSEACAKQYAEKNRN